VLTDAQEIPNGLKHSHDGTTSDTEALDMTAAFLSALAKHYATNPAGLSAALTLAEAEPTLTADEVIAKEAKETADKAAADKAKQDAEALAKAQVDLAAAQTALAQSQIEAKANAEKLAKAATLGVDPVNTVQAGSGSPDGKALAEEYAAITDPRAKANFLAKHKAALLKAAFGDRTA
jgi:hypothetical protein